MTPREGTGLRVTLDIWHPDCWTLVVTEDREAGLLGHGVYTIDGSATGRFTVYGETDAETEALVEAIRASSLTDSVWETDGAHVTAGLHGVDEPVPGNASRGIVVRYGIENSINDALVSRGFIPDEPVRMHHGREYWTVLVDADRETVAERIAAVREEMGAEIRIEDIAVAYSATGVLPLGDLSERQREVFDLARRRDYYTWPRDVSAADLAVELDISKATLLEHLRKAEAKLLGR
ncbi:helix-turn-helix domain-containing protein [Halococcus hamelinensis]|uniref:Bacterio-opsin activator HTH domain-containing protein n=1 Tax=Halococcus hamelinensis 100A6 TaxID=1132509 RepID=M0LTZ1_9EURY|nr:helix-turn-helix domain-containing protein [Halococcus hamelinensis]EMA36623.1 bacterio-opsin activator HTH domain-containing protein [Halococcus hamelinensis 100A6]